MKNCKKKNHRKLLRCLSILLAAVLIIMAYSFLDSRRVNNVSVSVPEETAEILVNPDCGIYHLYGFTIGDENEAKLQTMKTDSSATLCLIELNLRAYRDRDLPQSALTQIDDILSSLDGTGKREVVRFLYDWDGDASLTEPDSIDIILRHMEQVGPILLENRESIYTMQGLFTGNWGEMNGSRFSDEESLRTLASKLEEVTEGKIRLSVRTPQQWRIVNNISKDDLTKSTLQKIAGKSKFGLFNDGLTGSATDYGTYAADSSGLYESKSDEEEQIIDFSDFEPDEIWPRDAELAFQDILGTYQPNGGEAIHVSEWNDAAQAIRSFRRMHISYLNADYDSAVWEKWASQTVTEEGVFSGVNGEDYIRAHLGYRYVLTDADLQYNLLGNTISFSISVQNKGFAPSYADITAHVLLLDKSGKIIREKEVAFDEAPLKGKISAAGLRDGQYRIAVNFTDENGNIVRTANADTVFGTVTAK